MAACLSDELLLDLADGLLEESARREAVAHADACSKCRRLLAALARSGARGGTETGLAPPGAGGRTELARGDVVGRYVVAELLGTGAMGEVHAAHDPDLGRKVALKLLRPDASADVAALRSRLVREAQAMARLSHPNVLPVFDVGTHGGSLFLAMEHVDGPTLRAWLAEPRAWRAIVALFVEAGRGLAAAHAAGIVHRDFKPDNVLVGADGRARVADFGLAHHEGGDVQESGAALAGTPAGGNLTRAGELLGTPAYMAPEQMRGEPVTAAADQFSFCVALYEALYRRRPYRGERLRDVLAAATRGELEPPPRESRVPGWVGAVLARGLRPRPEDRHPSMPELLRALEADPRRTRRRAAAAVLGLAVTVGAVVVLRSSPPQATPCESPDPELAALWTPARRAQIRIALGAAGSPAAAAVTAIFEDAVDRYVAAWGAKASESCRATHVLGTQSQELLDLRMACLRRQREEVRQLVHVFGQPAPGLARRAGKAAGNLPDLTRCDADAALQARVPPPGDERTRAGAEALRTTLASDKALASAGQLDAALAAARLHVEVGRALGYPPVEAEALVGLGEIERLRLRPEEALATFERALRLASGCGDDRSAEGALVGLTNVVGNVLERRAEGSELAHSGRLLAERLHDELAAAELSYLEGRMASSGGDYRAARTHLEFALEVRVRLLGAEHGLVGATLSDLSVVAHNLGQLAEARAFGERALAIGQRELEPSGRENAGALNNLALILWEGFGESERAQDLWQRAVASGEAIGGDTYALGVYVTNLGNVTAELGEPRKGLVLVERGRLLLEQALSSEHRRVAYAHVVRGRILSMLGRYDGAVEAEQRALAILTAGGRESFISVDARQELARALLARGEPAEALAQARLALRAVEKLVSGAHPALMAPLDALCQILVQSGHPNEALPHCARAVEAALLTLGPAHPGIAAALASLAEALLVAGKTDLAFPYLESALAYLEPRRGDQVLRARTRFLLARALVATGGDEGRARRLATAARLDRVALASEDERPVETIDRWLASQGRAAPR